MKELLISIVSREATPNAVLIKNLQARSESHMEYLFVTSEEMIKKGDKVNCLIEAMGLSEAVCHTLTVPEYDISTIEQLLGEHLKEHNFLSYTCIHTNITGGTKPMSMGVYNVLRNLKTLVSVQFYYMVPRENYYIDPTDNTRDFSAFTQQLTLSEYLGTYGAIIQHRHQRTAPPDYTNHFAELYPVLSEAYKSVFEALRTSKYRDKGVKAETVPTIDGLPELLAAIDLPAELALHNGKLSKKAVQYLTGEWFEEWTYNHLLDELGLSDREIFMSCILVPRNEPAITNEFDVLYIENNTIHYIECKSSATEALVKQTVEKSNSLSKNYFGLTVRPYLLVYNSTVDPKVRDRARAYQITLLDQTELQHLEGRSLSEVMKVASQQ